MAPNFIQNGWALRLQPVIATAGYTLPSSKLETEKLHLVACDMGARPFDLYFDVDPNPSPCAPATCPYTTIGGNVTIPPPVPASDFITSDDVIEFVTAAAESHLQTRERMKFMQASKTGADTGEYITGDHVMLFLSRCQLIHTEIGVL